MVCKQSCKLMLHVACICKPLLAIIDACRTPLQREVATMHISYPTVHVQGRGSTGDFSTCINPLCLVPPLSSPLLVPCRSMAQFASLHVRCAVVHAGAMNAVCAGAVVQAQSTRRHFDASPHHQEAEVTESCRKNAEVISISRAGLPAEPSAQICPPSRRAGGATVPRGGFLKRKARTLRAARNRLC